MRQGFFRLSGHRLPLSYVLIKTKFPTEINSARREFLYPVNRAKTNQPGNTPYLVGGLSTRKKRFVRPCDQSMTYDRRSFHAVIASMTSESFGRNMPTAITS